MPETNAPSSAPQMPKIDPKSLVDTAVAVIKNPTEFFKGIKGESGFQKCLIFAVAMGVAAGVASFVVALLTGIVHGLFAAAIIGAVMALILTPIFVVIFALVLGIIVWVVSMIFGSKASWEPSIRIAAYATALAPVNAVLGIVGIIPILGAILGLLILLAMIAYLIYICVMGAKVLNFEPAPAAPPATPPAQ